MDIGRLFSAILYFITAIIEVLLTFRFALLLFSANREATFTRWIYENTDPLVDPFQGVFPSFKIAIITIELSTILAIIVYAVAAFILVQLVKAFEGFVVRPSGVRGGIVQPGSPQSPTPQQPPVNYPQTQPNQPVQPPTAPTASPQTQANQNIQNNQPPQSYQAQPPVESNPTNDINKDMDEQNKNTSQMQTPEPHKSPTEDSKFQNS